MHCAESFQSKWPSTFCIFELPPTQRDHTCWHARRRRMSDVACKRGTTSRADIQGFCALHSRLHQLLVISFGPHRDLNSHPLVSKPKMSYCCPILMIKRLKTTSFANHILSYSFRFSSADRNRPENNVLKCFSCYTSFDWIGKLEGKGFSLVKHAHPQSCFMLQVICSAPNVIPRHVPACLVMWWWCSCGCLDPPLTQLLEWRILKLAALSPCQRPSVKTTVKHTTKT